MTTTRIPQTEMGLPFDGSSFLAGCAQSEIRPPSAVAARTHQVTPPSWDISGTLGFIGLSLFLQIFMEPPRVGGSAH